MTYLNYLSTKFNAANKGLFYIVTQDKNILLHLIISFFTILVSVYLKLSSFEWMFVLSAIFLVIFSEIVNSVVELICDFIEQKQNSKIALIKDIMAGAVLFISFYALIVGLIIFYPKLISLMEVTK